MEQRLSPEPPLVRDSRIRPPDAGEGGGPAGSAAGWRVSWLFAAPHRIAFMCGTCLLVATAVWWLAATLAVAGGRTAGAGLPIGEIHGLVMAFGFMPFFFAGFMFTAVPKWLACRPVPIHAVSRPIFAQVAGWIVFMIAARSSDRAFVAAVGGLGLVAVALGWTQLWLRFVALVRGSGAHDRTHASVLALAGAAGALSLWAAAAGVTVSDEGVVRAATQAGLWLFVGGTFVAAAHRMIPFVGAAALAPLDEWRPLWLLGGLLALFGIEGLFAIVDALALALPAAADALRVVVELGAGLGLSFLALRRARVLNVRVRLVAMLHAGFAWLAVAFLLAGASHLLWVATDGELSLGAAPLHAYTMGFLGSILLAMVTRITCAQAGRTVVADDVLWRLFWLLQATIVLRVAGGVAAGLGLAGAWTMIVAAAAGWALLCVAWAWRYGPWYGQPRQDGRPG